MSVHEIVTRLKSLSETTRGLTSRTAALAKGSTSDHNQDSVAGVQARADLSAEIHQELKDLEEEFELVKQEAEDLASTGSWSSGARRINEERDRDRVAVAGQVERLSEELRLARGQFRKAQLQAKRNIEAAQRKEREQLFAGVQEGAQRSSSKRRGQEKLSEDDVLLNASSDVTAALRRTHQLMTSELQRSQFAHETLTRSTEALRSLNESYGNLDTLLASSKSLISTLVGSQKSDTWYLETAFWILVYTLVWLVFRRVFYGPVRYLAYLPTKWMLKLLFSLLQLFAGAFATTAATDSSSSGLVSTYSPMASDQAEVPIGMREGRANPALPRHQIPNTDAGHDKTSTEGESLTDKIGEMAEKAGEKVTSQRQDDSHDPEAEAENDEGWTAGDEEDHEEHGTVLRDPEPGETPNPKKRMWEEPVSGQERHDEL